MTTDIEDPMARTARIAKAGQDSPDRLSLISHILQDAGVKSMMEIGVWKGGFSAALLEACPTLQHYYMLDPWRRLTDWDKPLAKTPDFDAVHAQALAATDFAADRRMVLRGTTTEMIDRVDDEHLDAVYIDGDHTLRGVLVDLIASYPKVRNGGLILGDDFSRFPFQHGLQYEPTMVFPAAIHVAEAWGDPIVILPYGQFAIVKTDRRAHAVIDTVSGYDDRSLLGVFNLRDMDGD